MLFWASHFFCTFGLPSQSGQSCGNELDRSREDVAKVESQLLVIGKKACAAFFWTSSIDMVYCFTLGCWPSSRIVP